MFQNFLNMEIKKIEYEFLWEQVKKAYRNRLQDRGYEVDFDKNTIRALPEGGRINPFDYKGVKRLFPEIDFDKSGNPMPSAPLTIRSMIEGVTELKPKEGINNLNPYIDFYKALVPSSTRGRDVISLDDRLANIYARFCGYDDIFKLLADFGKDDTIDVYRAFFFSHVRYCVWDNGTIKFNYGRKYVEVNGFYQQDHDLTIWGDYERQGANLFLDLANPARNNRFMMILKVDPNDKNFGQILKGSLLTVSSYADNFLASTEVVLVKETGNKGLESIPEDVKQAVRRYFLLRRTRYTVTADAKDGTFIVDPAKEDANVYSALAGSYVGFLKSDDHPSVIAFQLTMLEDYRTIIRLPAIDHSSTAPLYLLGYLELGKLSVVHFAIIKGYVAKPGENDTISNLPQLGQLRSIIQLEYKGDLRALSGIMSITHTEGLLHGKVLLLKTDAQANISPQVLAPDDISKPSHLSAFSTLQQQQLAAFGMGQTTRRD